MSAVQESVERPATPADEAVEGEGLVEIQPAEFPSMSARQSTSGARPLSRFYDVKVTVTVELGRTSLPLSELLKLNEGAVVELNRAVGEPVDLVADGVLLARGEIVVVNECYGIRITEVNAANPSGDGLPHGMR